MKLDAPALVGIAHGTSSAVAAKAVESLMKAVTDARVDIPVILGFVDVQQPDATQAIDSLSVGQAAVVVPLLLSSGYHVHNDLTKAVSAQKSRRVELAKTLGPDQRLVELLQLRLTEVGFAPDDLLILAVAGSSDERARVDCESIRAALSKLTGCDVSLGYLSAAKPSLEEAIESARAEYPKKRIVVSSYLLAPGYFQSLIEKTEADVSTPPLLSPGKPTPSQLVEIVIDRYTAILKKF